jgi:glycerophosphoryl diester phosphodiesterase
LKENIEFETEFVLPTLREVLEHTNKNVFIYIEMKVPFCPELRGKYRWKEAAKEVFKLLMAFEMKEHCFVQSFDHLILEEFEKICTSELYKIRTLYLHNFYDYISLPPLEVILKQGEGISVSSNHVTPELVQACRQHGKILSVWIDCDVTVESTYLHNQMLELGVHCLITDMPRVATEVRQNFFANKIKTQQVDFLSVSLT